MSAAIIKTEASQKRRNFISKFLIYFFLIVITACMLLPFLWMLSSSFKGQEAIRTIPIRWIPERPTLEGYERVFNMQGFSFARASLNMADAIRSALERAQ